MAKSRPGGKPGAGWSALTWDDLEQWAGAGSVARGRTYQRGGRVTDLKRTEDGALLATVQGGERYATTVALDAEGSDPELESSCTCPVGHDGCKHAVAVVADYLQAIADGRDVPIADEDDPRWDELDAEPGEEYEDEYDDEDEYEDEDDDEPPPKPRRGKAKSGQELKKSEWDDKIERHIRAKSRGELADLAWSLVRRFPEIYQEFRERIALQEGDATRLVAEARREIKRVTSEPAWRNNWKDEGYTPDYSRIKHRLERLLDLGHADAVVSLGRDLLEDGLQQVGESHDEGEAAMAFAGCLPVVFQAVARSSLTGPERLLFAIDAELDDDFDTIGEATDIIFDAPPTSDDWSSVADTLAGRLEDEPAPGRDDFSRNYHRDRITGWIAQALTEAGREGEIRALYEAEAKATGSYERVVKFLMDAGEIEDAERWAREGIAATSRTYTGIANHLAESLVALARSRERWDEVAANAARLFFERPHTQGFDALIEAAEKAGAAEPVRAAALRFLETGAVPFRVIAPKPAPAPTPTRKATGKKKASPAPAKKPEPKSEPAPDRVKIDADWPLPIPDYLIPLLHRPNQYDQAPRPHLDVLLEMAIAAKKPDEVLRWFDKMRAGRKQPARYGYDEASHHAERVAEAVSAAYPERSIEIYRAALDAKLPHAEVSAYQAAAGYLKKLRPLYESVGRPGDWSALVASIREKYRNRPRFMELLDGLDGRTIVQSSRARRR